MTLRNTTAAEPRTGTGPRDPEPVAPAPAKPDPWRVKAVVTRECEITLTKAMLVELLRGATGDAVSDDVLIHVPCDVAPADPNYSIRVTWTDQSTVHGLPPRSRTLGEWAEAVAAITEPGESFTSEDAAARLGDATTPGTLTRALNDDPRFTGSSGRGWTRVGDADA